MLSHSCADSQWKKAVWKMTTRRRCAWNLYTGTSGILYQQSLLFVCVAVFCRWMRLVLTFTLLLTLQTCSLVVLFAIQC